WHRDLLDHGQVSDPELSQHVGFRHATAKGETAQLYPVSDGSIPRSSEAPSALAPLELGAQHREEMLVRRPEQPGPGRGPADLNRVPGLERESDLAIRGEHHVLIRGEGH